MQVYEVLQKQYADCPWPIPPSAILMHLPIREQKQKGMTSESILRKIISCDKRQRHCYNWLFRDVHVRPDKTFWDDGTVAKVKPRRHYAFRTCNKPVVSENRWATFLNHWTSTDLACATNLVCAHVCSDLSCEEHDLLRTLRVFHDVLLLEKDDPLHSYQMRLRSLHRMGILNLSLPREDASLAQVMARKRSLEASLRESRKRNERAKLTMSKMSEAYSTLEADRDAHQRLLSLAQSKLKAFQTLHPSYTHEEDVTLTDKDDGDAFHIFAEVDKDIDVQQQLKYDPSGALACFWADQRKQLSRTGRARRWNPKVIKLIACFSINFHVFVFVVLLQVLRYCFFLWMSLGNSKFDRLRDVLVLPDKRSLQMFKKKIPTGDGFRKESFQRLG